MQLFKKTPFQQEKSQTMQLKDKTLYSVFQPIYSFSNQSCIGAEVLVRGTHPETGFQVPVAECLVVPEDLKPSDYFYQLNRMHLNNWINHKVPNAWLFINIEIASIKRLEDLCLESLVREMTIHGREIVVEVVESEIRDEALFKEIITQLRALGCLIALDDFGAGHSNVDRIWKVEPDIVKLDRGVLIEATKSLRSQNTLRNLVKLIKQSGSVCLLEGIETQDQALLAMDVGVDLVQGFYFARPNALLEQVPKGEACIREVTEQYPAYVAEQKFVKNIQQKGYETLYENLDRCLTLQALEEAMQERVSLSFVKRFFILNERGYQVSEENLKENLDSRIEFMGKGKGLCWKNRRYFVQAKTYPEQLYVSEPYRSLIDMQLCLTLSKSMTLEGQLYVLCFDVFYHDKSAATVQISI